jgi:uncharacterized membrane protein YdjX (TVP38/TMEM64 family)
LHFLKQLSSYLLVLGLPGLFSIALLDSAGIPMMGGPDGLILVLAWQQPVYFPLITVIAAFGSTIGCLILYRIARAGGKPLLSRLAAGKQEWLRMKIAGNAPAATMLAVMAPPPFPTKPVILAAGVFRAPVPSFLMAVLAGRLIRYAVVAYIGARFGDNAAAIIRDHYATVLLALLVLVLLAVGIRWLRRARPAS